MNFDVNVDVNEGQFEFALENRWKYCRSSQIIKNISSTECNSNNFVQIFDSLLSISDTNYLNETVSNQKIKYMTNYSFEVTIIKEFTRSIKSINKIIFFATSKLN